MYSFNVAEWFHEKISLFVKVQRVRYPSLNYSNLTCMYPTKLSTHKVAIYSMF